MSQARVLTQTAPSGDKCAHHDATTTPYRDLFKCFSIVKSQFQAKLLAPVVQWLDNAIHRINHYPADKC